jgi:hypothetical protein
VTLAPRGGRELAEDEDDAMDEMYLWKKGSDYHERIGGTWLPILESPRLRVTYIGR